MIALVLVAFLSLATSGKALGLHDCPHHDALPGGQAHQSDHRDHVAAENSSPTDGEAGHEGPCTCVGICHGSAGAPLPGSVVADIRLASLPAHAPERPETGAVLPSLLPYILPYANGPPPGC